jgi:hypothetical protein
MTELLRRLLIASALACKSQHCCPSHTPASLIRTILEYARCRGGADGLRAEHIHQADQNRRAASGTCLRAGNSYAFSRIEVDRFQNWLIQGALVRASRYVTLMQVRRPHVHNNMITVPFVHDFACQQAVQNASGLELWIGLPRSDCASSFRFCSHLLVPGVVHSLALLRGSPLTLCSFLGDTPEPLRLEANVQDVLSQSASRLTLSSTVSPFSAH